MLFVEKDRHHANHMKHAVIFCEDHPCSGEENMYQRPVMAKRNQGNKPETLPYKAKVGHSELEPGYQNA
jgi:hypothetical protein